MSRLYYGTLYLIRPDRQGDPDHPEQSVVAAYRDGPSHIAVAIELWRLAGDEARAARIASIVERASAREGPLLNVAQVQELRGLLDGLDEALRGAIIDPDGRVLAERVPELRRRSKMLDLSKSRGDLARLAVWEGMTRVVALANILQEAIERGLNVALD